MSSLELQCIESWKKHCTDYTIKLWDENNFDYSQYSFTEEAYRLGKYAFVSDVCRLHALYTEGGVYLDTDMLLLKSLDSLLDNEIFVGEEKDGSLNGAIIGATKLNPQIEKLLEGYKNIGFSYSEPLLIPDYLNQNLDRTYSKVYDKKYFYPLPYRKKDQNYQLFIQAESIAVHLWNHSWKNEWDYLHDKNFRKALKSYILRVSKKPGSVFKGSFHWDFLKYFLADHFSFFYKKYKGLK